MQTVVIELTDIDSLMALQDLERKHLIRIVEEPTFDSDSLPSEPIIDGDLKSWVDYTESLPTVSSAEAKQRWAVQRKKLTLADF